MYEGLNRAQNSRIEDQRGTEINFELPDFLKDKENSQKNCHRIRKATFRRTDDALAENSRFYDADLAAQHKQERLLPPMACTRNLKAEPQSNYENRNITVCNDKSLSNHHNLHNFKLNNLRIYSPSKLSSSDESFKSNQSTPMKLNATVIENVPKIIESSPESPKGIEPPPLPPKPKILPIKPSNWGQSGLFKVPKPPRTDGVKQSFYLEQSTSSFV